MRSNQIFIIDKREDNKDNPKQKENNESLIKI